MKTLRGNIAQRLLGWAGAWIVVAGLVGGTGMGLAGKYSGVAPGVNLISVKVASNLGLATASDVVAGLQWVLVRPPLI